MLCGVTDGEFNPSPQPPTVHHMFSLITHTVEIACSWMGVMEILVSVWLITFSSPYGSSYWPICVMVHVPHRFRCVYTDIHGEMSPEVYFRTLPCEPSCPRYITVLAQTRTTLQIKWTGALDNGSRITTYCLQYAAMVGDSVSFLCPLV